MHTIRLREPWQLDHHADRRLEYTRAFHRPSGLDPQQDVTLRVVALELISDVQASLNDRLIDLEAEAANGSSEALQWSGPIGGCLQPFNQLRLVITLADHRGNASPSASELLEVQLEIKPLNR